MDTATGRFLYKYFEPADRFVRIRIWGTGGAPPVDPRDLDRAGYQRAVIEASVAELADLEVLAGSAAATEETAGTWNALGQLVFDVNPELDIRNVGIPGVDAAVPAKARARTGTPRWKRRTRGLEERLRQRIIGQDDAIRSVVRTVRRAAAGLATERSPLGSFLFVGPTGTGKTELARALAEEVGGSDGLIRVDCSEFGEAHEYAKLIGSPPGYVGHGEGGSLTEAIARQPGAVVLFDEVEKAHPRLAHLLLQVLDEGRLTDGRGRTADFRQAFIVLTSNAGTRDLARASAGLGFGRMGPTDQTAREIVGHALERIFEPEFLGRLDEIVSFHSLNASDVVRIAEQELTRTAVAVRRAGGRVRISSAVARWIAERGFGEHGGARGIAAVVRREVETPLADALLDGGGHGWLRVSIRRGRPHVARVD